MERERSGRGQPVETSLLEALVGSLSFQAARYLNTGEVPPPVGNHHPLTAPMGVRVVGLPVRLGRTPARVRTAAPLPGSRTREVLGELGYDADAVDGLMAEGVVEEAKLV